ncbi:MAG: hypothetical protein IJ456_02920 [Bacteroides sp.]|nr:hypothetical protein [Bacteroides sp.]
MEDKEVKSVVVSTKKKAYVTPMMKSESFVPNEYVAACTRITDITATCARPGSSGGNVIGDGTSYGNNIGSSVEGDDCRGSSYGKIYHGVCGNPSTIYLDGSLNGLENNGRPITNVIIGAKTTVNNYYKISVASTDFDDLEVGSTYNATWNSTDNHGCSYTHWGALKVTGFSHS